MSIQSMTNRQKMVALAPLVALSTAWGVALGTGGFATALDSEEGDVPDVPGLAIEKPASIEAPPGVDERAGRGVAVSTLSPNGIPSAALYAYRRAETLLARADEECKLPWNLVAAIGRVESNHGRINGSKLNEDGLAVPGIFGIPLDGRDGTRRIDDTDGGKLDRDTVLDRAVGPMQFIPSTWENVAVDADADGEANPQDIDDAAAAAGVYLCAGPGDLSDEAGAAEAVGRYNHSSSYVDLVMEISKRYAAGEFSEMPDGYSTAPSFTNRASDQSLTEAQREESAGREAAAVRPAPEPSAPAPAAPEAPSLPTAPSSPAKTAGKTVESIVEETPLAPVTKPVTDLLSVTEARLRCGLKLPLGPQAQIDACVTDLTTP